MATEQIINHNNEEVVTTAEEHATEQAVEEGGHEITLYAEPVFHLGNFTITNSLLTSWLAVFLIIVLAWIIARSIKKVPGKFIGAVEMIVDGALNTMDLVTGDREKSRKIFPVIFGIFVFILINNLIGLLPGIGSISFNHHHLFRGATADLNTTLALGIFAVLAANVLGVISVGAWNYFNKFVNIKSFLAIPKEVKKDPMSLLVNPIHFFVGLIEIISEIAKVLSLSLRLFGNVFAGEVLLASMAAIFAFVLPLPFMFLELLVGVIQALIFSVLTLVYFTVATTSHEH